MKPPVTPPVNDIPPPPEHHMSAVIDQNQISAEGRAILALSWKSPTRDAAELSVSPNQLNTSLLNDPELYEEFWEDDGGAIAPLPSFQETVEEAKNHPEQFTRNMVADFSRFVTPITNKYYHALTDMPYRSEADALVNLDAFLDKVVEESAGDNPEIFERATMLKENLGYLSEAQFEEGIEVLANMWVEYLKQHEGAFINLYRRPNAVNHKSFEYVMERIKERVFELDMSASLRLYDTPDKWNDTAGSLLVVVDDWVISGQSALEMSSNALKEAQKRGLKLKNGVEVHTIAREATASVSPGVTYRSVFLHDSGVSFGEASMAGSHSTVNFGFEHPLREMQKYLQDKGVFIPAPILMNIEPVLYRDIKARQAITADRDNTLWTRVSRENRRALETLGSIFEKEEQVKTLVRRQTPSASTAQLEALLDPNSPSEESIDSPNIQILINEIAKLRLALNGLAEERAALRKELGWPPARL